MKTEIQYKLIRWYQKLFNPLPDLLEEAKETEELNKADNVIDARQRFLKHLRKEQKKHDEYEDWM